MASFVNNARIALCQVGVSDNKAANIARVKDTLRKAVSETIDVAVLPEIWNSPYATTFFPKYAEFIPDIGAIPNEEESPSTAMLVEMARDHNIWIIGGSIPEKVIDSDSVLIYNTCSVISPEGQIVAKHRKMHLFDINIPGRIAFRESDTLKGGEDVTVVDTPWGGIGIGICYDIRFPELAMVMRKRGCRLLVYPGAFNMVTGPAHWELLQRARAVDNQLFVAACSPARNPNPNGGYVAWGHSSVVSPWGTVIAQAAEGEEIVYADLDFAEAEKFRQDVPCWSQKRLDVYDLIDKKKL